MVLYYPRKLLQLIVDWAVSLLTDPVKIYNPSEVTNVRSLISRLKVGDVVLVSGNARISHVVKVLTLSQWSHVVLYVGDRRDLLTKDERDEWQHKFGESALKHLVIDADPIRGVHLKPIADFVGLMLRHCRPEAIRGEDIERVVRIALSQLGREYDIIHIVRLLFFFGFPWELLPESLRRMYTDFTLSESDRICSRVLSEAFHSVNYPIRPLEVVQSRGDFHRAALGVAFGLRRRAKSAATLFRSGRMGKGIKRLAAQRYTEIHLRSHRHITPADYDLSRFFTILKDEDDLHFNYRSAHTLCPWPRTNA